MCVRVCMCVHTRTHNFDGDATQDYESMCVSVCISPVFGAVALPISVYTNTPHTRARSHTHTYT